MESDALRWTEVQLRQQILLLRSGGGNPSQADFASLGGGQNNVGALQGGKQSQSLGRCHLQILPSQEVLQGHPERIAQERHQDVRLHPPLQPMKHRPNRQLAFQSPKTPPALDSILQPARWKAVVLALRNRQWNGPEDQLDTRITLTPLSAQQPSAWLIYPAPQTRLR